jgi:phosphotransferase system HPr (HPr) family protein
MTRLESKVTIVNKLGLHARAATKLAQLCKDFEAKVCLSLNGKEADASSIMALLLLAGAQGKEVTILAEGPDAAEALAAVSQLINDKFEEQE